jgi:hypothetical protein
VRHRGQAGLERDWGGVRDAVEHLDLAALLADEHRAVGSELDVDGIGQATPDGLIGEACGRVAASAGVADRATRAASSPSRAMAARIRCLNMLWADRRMAHPLEQ